MMGDPLTLDDLATFRRLGPHGYMREVMALFQSPRATPDLWHALGYAVLHVSESSAGAMVVLIDQAILQHLEAGEKSAPC